MDNFDYTDLARLLVNVEAGLTDQRDYEVLRWVYDSRFDLDMLDQYIDMHYTELCGAIEEEDASSSR